MYQPKMKVKVVIFQKDRTNKSKVLSKANRLDNKIRLGNTDYLITNKDSFCITRKWFRNYITYYFVEDSPNPLPVPNFTEMKRSGISTDELNAIFTPFFYRVLAKNNVGRNEKILFYLVLANLAASGYLLYYVLVKLPEMLGVG